MIAKRQLNPGDRHLLRLVRQGQDDAGWAKVSPMVWPLMAALPTELVALEGDAESGGKARLTQAGGTVLDWT